MNRTLFLAFYISGIVATWLAGDPWSRINFLLLNPSKPGAALTVGFAVSLLAPAALVLIAALRGSSIGRPRLLLLPLVAILFSSLAFIYGWLSRALAGGGPSATGFLPMQVAVGIGLLAAFLPLAIHLACCILGASEPKSPLVKRRSAA